MVSTTAPGAPGIDASRRADEYRRAEEARRAEEVRLAEEATRTDRQTAAASSTRSEDPAVVYDNRIAEMRRASEASAQPGRSPNSAAVKPSARMFDITV